VIVESAILLGIAFASIAWIGTIFRIAMNKRLDLVDWFVGAMGAFNGIGYAFVIWATHAGMNPFWAQRILPYDSYYWIPPALSLIAAGSVWMGAMLAGGSRKTSRESADLTPNALARIQRLAWGFLFAGIFCYYLYTKAYGGFFGLLDYSALIRSAQFDMIGIDNKWSFLGKLGSLVFFSSFLFYSVLLEGRLKDCSRFIFLLGSTISVGFSLYVLYSWLARVQLIMYISVFPLAYIYYKSRNRYSMAPKLSFIFLIIAIALPVLSLWMTPGKASTSIIEFYARELSFPTVSILSTIESHSFRFFFDIVVAPIYVLPSKIWSGLLGVVTANEINTEMILGYRKGEGGVTGTIPVDFITFGYMQMGLIGVTIIGIVAGVGLVWLERLLLRIPGRGLHSVLYAYCVFMIGILTILYSDPVNIIQRNIHFIIGIGVIFALFSWKHIIRRSTKVKKVIKDE
jgi:hypothetical protein